MKKLPLSTQTFEKMILEDLLYVDKTPQIFKLLDYGSSFFLSRPRRFGKSLLVSTLEALFLGRRELFKGLWIEDKIKWEAYPVIRLNFADITYEHDLDLFDRSIIGILSQTAARHKIVIEETTPKEYLRQLLPQLKKKTGKGVVVLIDEYDKPITDFLTDMPLAERNRLWLRSIYEVLKGREEDLRFLFITGISKFAKMSIFSVMNNIRDITLSEVFNDLTGFREDELLANFDPYLDAFALQNEWSRQEALEKIRDWYNGYSWDGRNKIYNPFAIVNLFQENNLRNYWFESGTPGFLVQLFKKKYALETETFPSIADFESVPVHEKLLDSYDLENIQLHSLLFQTGYLTVKSKRRIEGEELFIIGYPNLEVRASLNSYVLEIFTQKNVALDIKPKALLVKEALSLQNMDDFGDLMRSFFAGIPARLHRHGNESYYQALFYMILTLLGVEISLEKTTDKGYVDGVLDLTDKIYLIEFKYATQGTMKALLDLAMRQIHRRKYFEAWLGNKQKPVLLLAVGFLHKADKPRGKKHLNIDFKVEAWKRESN